MKKNQHARYALAVLSLLSITAPLSAFADSTFLLQLGSFDSEDKASAKWDDLKSKNKDVLGGLTLHVAEVALPPDNNVTYRTQAGPVSSHDKAAALCATLTARGASCNVVETALFVPKVEAQDTADATPTPAAAPAATTDEAVPTLAVAPKSKPGFFGRLFGSSSTPTPPAAPEPVAAPVTPVATTTMPEIVPLPNAAVEPPAPPALPPTPPAPPVPVVAAPAIVAPVVADSVPAAAPVPIQVVEPETPPAPAPEPKPSKPGFFGRLFGSSPTKAPAPKPVSIADADAPVPVPVPPAAPVVAPRPPAPPVPMPAHMAQPFVAPAIVGTAAPSYAAKPGAIADVQVAEAIRVPVGSGQSHKHAVIAGLPAVHGLGGSPSQGTKGVWAQMGYFEDEDSARGFYQEFQDSYPQFTDGVRMRVTHPYSQNGTGRVSLRVGPFADVSAVRTICVAASKRGLRCGGIKEVPSYSSVASRHPTASRPIGTYQEHSDDASPLLALPTESAGTVSTFWVQLGSFHSADDAWDEWKSFKEDYSKVLKHVEATVTSPARSSASDSVYRLRAGPFTSQSSADALCSKLGDANCIVVNDN